MKRIKSALAALLLLLTLTGCGMTSLNAAAYVRGLLDETYKREYSQAYLTLVGVTVGEAEENYQAGLRAEYGRFAEYFLLDAAALSRETEDAFLAYLAGLYAQSRYEVTYATRSDSGAWLVEVTAQPIVTLAELAEQVDGLRADFDALEDVPPEEREEAWAALVLDACQTAAVEYGEETTIAVRLTSDEDGYYSIGARDFYNLDALILTYED